MQKSVYVQSIAHDVIIARRKGTRSLRLAIKSDGTIRLSIPYLVSEKQAIKFIDQKSEWITKNHKRQKFLEPNSHIGKSHRLNYEKSDIEKIKTRLTPNTITIKTPQNLNWSDISVQKYARTACERALKKESENLLPQRVKVLSEKYSIPYKSCSVKKLKSRWGSCDSNKNITLNIYLIQLDWKLIDYVILHELTHTIHQHHQTEFWAYLDRLLPENKQRRKELKQMPTDIIATSF